MTAPVRIEAEAWGDLRFAALSRALGLAGADHALILTAKIWSWQTEHYTPDAPTYVVDELIVDSSLGDGGAIAMVRVGLAELAPGGIRIRGSEGRIEWLWKIRAKGRKGADATRRKHGHQTDQVSHPEFSDAEYETGPRGLPAGLLQPGPLSPVPVPIPDRAVPDQNRTARAPSGLPDPSSPPIALSPPDARAPEEKARAERDRWCTAKWAEVNEHRQRIAKRFGLGGVRELAVMDQGRIDLGMRVRDGAQGIAADVEHVIAVRVAEAEATKSVRWLGGGMFRLHSDQWDNAIAMSPDDARRVKGSPPPAAAKPRTTVDNHEDKAFIPRHHHTGDAK